MARRGAQARSAEHRILTKQHRRMHLDIKFVNAIVRDFEDICDEIHCLHRNGDHIPEELAEAVSSIKAAVTELEEALAL